MPSNENHQTDEGRHSVDEQNLLAETVRQACIDAARAGFQEAKMAGLCDEGAWENAIGAIEMMDVDGIIARKESP